MSERNKLKTTLREHYDAQEVAYNEQDWQAASSLLDAERNKNKRRVAAYMLTALLGLSFLGFSIYKNFKDNSEKQISSYSKSIPETNQASTENKVSSNSEPEGRQRPGTVTTKTIQNSYPNKRVGHSTVQLKQTFLNERNTPKEFTPGDTKAPEAAVAASGSVSSQTNFNETDSGSDKVVSGEPKHFSGSHQNVNSIGNSKSEQLENRQTNLISDQESKSESTPEGQEARSLLLPMIYSKTLNENKAELVLKGDPKIIETNELIQKPDTAIVASPDPASPQIVEDGIFYELGAAWLYGWKNTSGRDARGLSPLAGINYMNRISNRLSLSFGIQYMQVRNLSASSRTSKESIYRYGEQSKVTTITPSTLHYLLAPLRLNYFIDNRSSFGAGVNLAYLLNVEARVNTYDEKPGSTENHKTYKQGGYTEGVSWYDSQVALFYTRKIRHTLALKAEVFFGLTDIKQNNFFGLNYTERNSGAKITLIYYAFTKKNRQ